MAQTNNSAVQGGASILLSGDSRSLPCPRDNASDFRGLGAFCDTARGGSRHV